MDLSDLTETLRARVGQASGLGATLKFDCGADGLVVIDGAAVPNTVDNADRAVDCTVAVSRADLQALLAGDLNPVTGFMTGRLRVAGDMAVAMKLQRLV